MLDNIYLSGFVQRCAERGVNPDVLIKQSEFVKKALSEKLMLRAAALRLHRLMQKGFKPDILQKVDKMMAGQKYLDSRALNSIYSGSSRKAMTHMVGAPAAGDIVKGIVNADNPTLARGLNNMINSNISRDIARISTLIGRDLNYRTVQNGKFLQSVLA